MINKYKKIVEKLGVLNQYSSEDFLKMSVSLKNNYSKATNFIEDALFITKKIKKEIVIKL